MRFRSSEKSRRWPSLPRNHQVDVLRKEIVQTRTAFAFGHQDAGLGHLSPARRAIRNPEIVPEGALAVAANRSSPEPSLLALTL